MKNTDKQAQGRGAPQDDVCCRGCHSKPSYKNINTHFCSECWDLWNKLRRSAQVLEDSAVDDFKEELIAFIKSRERYVWHPEVYLHLRPVSLKELKRHNIKVATICRDLRLFAPADDRITQEAVKRVRDFTMNYLELHSKTPILREVMDGTGIDHTTLWSCMDFDEFVGGLGGKVDTDVRYRFRDTEEFLQAAAQVVREADCPLHMTVILEELGICYPAYLSNFEGVSPEAIHDAAGVSRSLDGLASLLEVAGRKAINELGYEVEPQVSFPGLIGKGGGLLRYDFRVVGTRILVEIDGDQHYDPNSTFYTESMAVNDVVKDNYAKRNGYQLIRVDTRTHKSPWSMKEFLRPRIGVNPHSSLNPSNALNTTGPARRGIKRGETRDRPNQQ